MDPVPISLVAHTVFCPRRAWLEASGEHVESFAIEHGTAAHKSVDDRDDDRSARRRSVDVVAPSIGLIGRCDVVQIEGSTVEVVEFKSAPFRKSTVVTAAQRAQLALQGIALREMGYQPSSFFVHFTTSRRSVPVELRQDDYAEAREWLAQTVQIINASEAPPPLVDDPKCSRCSHAGICLPDERQMQPVRRRVLASDPEGQVLHLSTAGARASLTKGRVVVKKGEEELGSLPIEKVAGLVVIGKVDVSSALIRELLWRNVSVVWCSWTGRVTGFAQSAMSPNGGTRIRQVEASAVGDLALARELIASKVHNQATQLRRSGRGDSNVPVAALRRCAERVGGARSLPEILGIEGEAASVYFGSFIDVFSTQADQVFADTWHGRTGRGALDPTNVALNYAYGMLLGEVIRAVVVCGMDAHAGFVHSSGRNKPALALDLMEQFRPIVADSAVVTAINNLELRERDFSTVLGGWRLRDSGRKTLISVVTRRLDQEITHPVFHYKVTWRRCLEIQARLLLGYLDGSQPSYRGLRTR